MGNVIDFKKYSDAWPYFFNKEKDRLVRLLKPFKYSSIEHIGATSAIHCDTAGTIDGLLSIPNKLDLITFKNYLSANGYEAVENRCTADCVLMYRRNSNGGVVFTLRIVEYASKTYNVIKAFKYYLKENVTHAYNYNNFRQEALYHSKCIKDYNKLKTDYIKSIIAERFEFK